MYWGLPEVVLLQHKCMLYAPVSNAVQSPQSDIKKQQWPRRNQLPTPEAAVPKSLAYPHLNFLRGYPATPTTASTHFSSRWWGTWSWTLSLQRQFPPPALVPSCWGCPNFSKHLAHSPTCLFFFLECCALWAWVCAILGCTWPWCRYQAMGAWKAFLPAIGSKYSKTSQDAR